MRLDDQRRLPRWLAPALVTASLLAAVTVPAALWFLRGRRVPLRVVAQASAYVVQSGARVRLTAHVEPRAAGGQTEIRWSGRGLSKGPGGAEALFVAPAQPGVYNLTLHARRSGTLLEDRLSVQVVRGSLDQFRLVRPQASPRPPPPPAASEPPSPRCAGGPAEVRVHGRACRGGNLVVELRDAARFGPTTVWHFWQQDAARGRAGRVVNLRVPPTTPAGQHELSTLVLGGHGDPSARPDGSPCRLSLRTLVAVADCADGPASDAPVFADFVARLTGPGAFRFAARPSRQPRVRHVTYEWDLGDGSHAESASPAVAHHYAAPRRYRLVRLRVTARLPAGEGEGEGGEGEVTTRVSETVRVIHDRSVERDHDLGE